MGIYSNTKTCWVRKIGSRGSRSHCIRGNPIRSPGWVKRKEVSKKFLLFFVIVLLKLAFSIFFPWFAILNRIVLFIDFRVVVLLCGGNIDTTVLGRCLERGLAADGRLVKFTVCVSDRPGGIAELCGHMAKIGVSVKDIMHDRPWLTNDLYSVMVSNFYFSVTNFYT